MSRRRSGFGQKPLDPYAMGIRNSERVCAVRVPRADADAPPMDDQAFAGFYARSARPLWAYLARTSGDAALAEDLMQESYVRFLCAAQRPFASCRG